MDSYKEFAKLRDRAVIPGGLLDRTELTCSRWAPHLAVKVHTRSRASIDSGVASVQVLAEAHRWR
jgi:hypothetical protein